MNGIPNLCYDKLKSVLITKEEYNYLLPAMRKNLLARRGVLPNNQDEYSFIGDNDAIQDMRERLIGLSW